MIRGSITQTKQNGGFGKGLGETFPYYGRALDVVNKNSFFRHTPTFPMPPLKGEPFFVGYIVVGGLVDCTPYLALRMLVLS